MADNTLVHGEFVGTVVQMHSDPKNGKCACCPEHPTHVFSLGIKYDEGQKYEVVTDGEGNYYETMLRNDYGRMDTFINDHCKPLALDGKRIRVTVHVDILP